MESTSGCYYGARRLVVQSMPDAVRHFGYQLYEELVRNKWEVLGEGERKVVREELLVLLRNGTKGLQEEAQYVKRKVVPSSYALFPTSYAISDPDM